MAVLLFFAAALAGAIASLAGFGIGSVLTPLLALSVGTKQAVVAVSIPHLRRHRHTILVSAAQD
ncbi:MAG TPA: hypothetical protein VFT65_09200 [Candidatus Angelobacter sp.]|nr:hypothetical protein [Candidatus Angelobacter sp.]